MVNASLKIPDCSGVLSLFAIIWTIKFLNSLIFTLSIVPLSLKIPFNLGTVFMFSTKSLTVLYLLLLKVFNKSLSVSYPSTSVTQLLVKISLYSPTLICFIISIAIDLLYRSENE